ncbi:MAG: translation elongation factor Ts [Patescibacteria group bacterium]
MAIKAQDIQKLRQQTGIGMMDCKKFLQDAGGDFDKAVEAARKQGEKIAAKKADREASEGLIDAYIHPGNQVGVLIQVNCETDFVARNEEFKELVHDLAMHIAAYNPTYISSEDIPEDVIAKEKEIIKEQLKNEGKPAKMLDKIMTGKIEKYYEEVCLLNQSFLKNEDQSVKDYLEEKISKIGENISVAKFERFALK